LPAALSVAERPSHFLLRAQEKVTKEKGTPRGRLAGVLPAKCVKGGRGFSTAHPWADEKQADLRVGFPAGFSAHPSPPPRGPDEQARILRGHRRFAPVAGFVA